MSISERYYTVPQKELPTLAEADVLVAGAGTAGCIAAIAAARAGARTVVFDKAAYPGGTFTNGGLIANSLHASTSDGHVSRRLVQGICGELMDRLIAEGGAPGYIPTRAGNCHYRPFELCADHEIYKAVIIKMLREAGVTVLLHTWFSDVIREGEALRGVIVEGKGGREVIWASQFIDATGDGVLAARMGCPQTPLWKSYKTPVCGLVFGVDGVDFPRLCEEGRREGFLIEADSIYAGDGQPVDGQLRVTLRFDRSEKYRFLCESGLGQGLSSLMAVSIHPGQITYLNAIGTSECDPYDPVSMSRAEMALRIRSIEVVRLLREHVPGFENAYVCWTSRQAGVRASNATLCEKNLTNAEIVFCTRFQDEIGLMGYHDLAPKEPACAIPDDQCYGLPYRMLLPRNAENLLMAGRTMTDEYKAHMATRNTVACMMTGQAAGVAAALCTKQNCTPRALAYDALRAELIRQSVQLA